jgi:hypothetical protein
MTISVRTRPTRHIITMKSPTSIKEFHREENIVVTCGCFDVANSWDNRAYSSAN